MTISTTIGRAVSLAMAVFAITTPVVAEPAGLAVYASYQDSGYAAHEAQKLQALLQSPVEKNQVVINGQTYTRLQSPALSTQSARTLVEKAKGAGYSAWFIKSRSVATQPDTARTVADQPVATQPIAKSIVKSAPEHLILGPDNPELKLQLPEGPLLGDLFPPSSPLPE